MRAARDAVVGAVVAWLMLSAACLRSDKAVVSPTNRCAACIVARAGRSDVANGRDVGRGTRGRSSQWPHGTVRSM